MSVKTHPRFGFITETLRSCVDAFSLKDVGICDHIPYLRAATNTCILTKRGELIASATVDGLDSFTCENLDPTTQANDFSSLVGQLGERFGIYVSKITIPAQNPLEHFEEMDFCGQVDRAWRDHLKNRALKKRVFLISVAIKAPLTQSFGRRGGSAFAVDMRERIEKLEDAMGLLEAVYEKIGYRRLSISDGDWLGYLGATFGQDFQSISPVPGRVLATCLTNFDVKFERRVIRFRSGSGEKFGTIFGVKSYPDKTGTRMLDELELPYDIVLTNSFTPIRPNEAEETIKRSARQRGATEDAAASLTAELFDAADNVASGRQIFGKHHMTIMVTANSESELEAAATEVWRAGQSCGAVLVRYGAFSARAAFFSQAPGNWNYRCPTGLISADNFARFSAFHSASDGRPGEQSPWSSNITLLPTIRSGAYRFNFHEKGHHSEEPSAGHTLVLGRPGSGKTLGTAFLMAQARRVHARVIAFDKDLGLEMAVRAMGGSYSSIRVGQSTGFNPFLTETDDRGAAWLTDWLSDILARNKPLETHQTVALNEAVKQITDAEPALRNFRGLRELVASTDDDGDLAARVGEWTDKGRHGWLFDKETTTPIEIGEDVVGIDMTEILDLNMERSALLAYLFRRVERVIEDRKPTLIVIDEAWKMLNDEIFEKRLRDWLVTMRKKNCVVAMLTQTPGHLTDSKVGAIIAETVNTQILFPNSRAKPEDYHILRTNDNESAFLSSSTGGMRLALVRSGGDSVFVNFDLSGLGSFLPILGGGRTGEERAPFNWRDQPDFWKEML